MAVGSPFCNIEEGGMVTILTGDSRRLVMKREMTP
jgi:hypothetical protein